MDRLFLDANILFSVNQIEGVLTELTIVPEADPGRFTYYSPMQ